MKTEDFKISLSYNQILELVKQLPASEKRKLSRELEKEMIDSKLTELFNRFHTDELSQDDIDREVEQVRAKR